MSASSIKTIIVAGGRGERMRPWTDRIPKPMIPVAGKPILEHQLEWLRRAGVSEVIMCLGYKAEAVQEYVGDGGRWGLKVDYRVESSPRGTAGCVRDAWPKSDAQAFVLYGDVFIDISLSQLMACHRRMAAAATLVLAESDHPYDSDLVRAQNGLVTGFYRAQPGAPCDPLACAAAWIVGKSILALVPEDKPSDFGRDIFPLALARGLRLAGFKTTDLIADLGTPERLEAFAKHRGGNRT